MKPPTLAVAPQDLKAADAVYLERQRVLHRALDEEYFRRELSPGLCFYNGGVTEVAVNDTLAMRFPASPVDINARAGRLFEARQLWVRTRPRLYIWYTTVAASATAIAFRWVLRVFGAGSPTASGNYFLVQWTAPGPTVAGQTMLTTVVAPSVFPSSPYGVVQVNIGRDGDSNANALDVLLAVVVMEEVA